MRVRNLTTIVASAAATMVLTLTLFGPDRVGADKQSDVIPPEITHPTLTLDTCNVVLTTDRPQYKAGDVPKLTLQVINKTDKPLKQMVVLRLQASAPSSPLSRIAVLPEEVWKRDVLVDLAPGEKKTLDVDLDLKLPEGKSIAITMSDNETTTVSHSLVVVEYHPQQPQTPVQLPNITSGPS